MQGEVIYEAFPHWKVVRRVGAPKKANNVYDVIDTSLVAQGQKPLRVYGPTTKDEAIGFARSYAMTYLTLKGVFL